MLVEYLYCVLIRDTTPKPSLLVNSIAGEVCSSMLNVKASPSVFDFDVWGNRRVAQRPNFFITPLTIRNHARSCNLFRSSSTAI